MSFAHMAKFVYSSSQTWNDLSNVLNISFFSSFFSHTPTWQTWSTALYFPNTFLGPRVCARISEDPSSFRWLGVPGSILYYEVGSQVFFFFLIILLFCLFSWSFLCYLPIHFFLLSFRDSRISGSNSHFFIVQESHPGFISFLVKSLLGL